ncbi:MAG TPA: DUF4215 domain-containing protein [Kofleriaceae bacterium]
MNDPSCKAANTLCGNGTSDIGEACDDGNTVDGDGCDSNCTISACGNGVKAGTEACDDGNVTDGDGCDSNCTATACGNGVKTGQETCDDGNLVDGDGCDSNCRPSGCGNGVKTGTEACDDGNTTNGDGCDNNCTVTACGNGIQTGTEACDDGNTANWDGCNNTCSASVFTYFKASNTNAGDSAGVAVALSADGMTLAVGADAERSAATGVNGNQNDNTKEAAGAVYVFARTGATWTQKAYIKASNTDAKDHFGAALSLSADGTTLAVGAVGEDGGSTTDQADNTTSGAGAVYVFGASNGAWSQQAYLKATAPAANDQFGASLSLSGDGKSLAVGALGGKGSAYVFTRTGNAWAAQATVTASNGDDDDNFGQSVALSTDGTTLAVGANHEASGSATDPTDNSAAGEGAAYVFVRAGDTWTQQGYLKAADGKATDDFGFSVSVSGDGSTVAVGADVVIAGTAAAGEAYVFSRTGTTWAQSASLRSVHARGNAFFGYSVSLSTNGQRLAVGAWGESSGATGVGGDESRIDAGFSGAAYVFVRGATAWTQQSYIKATNTNTNDFFGRSVSLSSTGGSLAVGAPFESGAATGINGDQASNAAGVAGAAYVYE